MLVTSSTSCPRNRSPSVQRQVVLGLFLDYAVSRCTVRLCRRYVKKKCYQEAGCIFSNMCDCHWTRKLLYQMWKYTVEPPGQKKKYIYIWGATILFLLKTFFTISVAGKHMGPSSSLCSPADLSLETLWFIDTV